MTSTKAILMTVFTIFGPLFQNGSVADQHNSLEPVVPNFQPGLEYSDRTRAFQGIPGLERSKNGRLWATWYAGGPNEPGEGAGNYVVLVTSADEGRTWSEPKMVIDPPGDVRAYDPAIWHDPQGRLWLFWAQSSHWWDGRSGVWCIVTENSGEASPKWSEPRRLCDGIMMNKPTVTRSGDWLLPVSIWAQKADSRTRPEHRMDLASEVGARVMLSRDQGQHFEFAGKTQAPESIFDEHMIIERRDGSLWMLMRTRFGMAESFSNDGAKSWTPGQRSTIKHVNSRFFIRRLKSGSLLLVRHHPPDGKTRSHLSAWISDDDGKSWKGGLLIDPRPGVSYPDGVEEDQGRIRIIYDYQRTRDRQILMAVFSESAVLKSSPSDLLPDSQKFVVNQAGIQNGK